MGKKRKEKEGDKDREETEERETPSKKSKIEEDKVEEEGAEEQEEKGEDDSQDAQKIQREKMQLLVSAFSNAQQDQYEIFRRSTSPKSGIRKIMQSICGGTVPQNAVIAMAGITKVYVGEVIEAACQARDSVGEEGPLQPKHIREAVRRLKKDNKIPNSRYKRVFPFR